MIKTLSLAIFALSVVMATVLGGALLGNALFEQAVAECQTYGGHPVAVENRLAYVCATPYGRISP